MNEFTTYLILILFFKSMVYVAKRLGFLDVNMGRSLYKFLFAIPLPILVFISLADSKLETQFLILPLIGGLLAIILVAVAFIIGKALKLDQETLGTLMTAAGITSTLSFALPFIGVFYGQDATRYLFLYDFGGAAVVWTFVYYISGLMGNKRGQKLSQSIKIFVKTPMLWALIGGIIVSIIGISLPEVLGSMSIRLGGFVNPVILIGIGIFLDMDFFKHKKNLSNIILGVFITMGISVTLAYILTLIFGVSDVAQKVVLISALSPSGALTVPFCAEHKLNTEYASALVALPILIAIILIPLLIAL